MYRLIPGMVALLVGAAIFVILGFALESGTQQGMLDFYAIYTGAQCVLHHQDPYRESEFLKVYFTGGGTLPADPAHKERVCKAVAICINLPTTIVTPLPMCAAGRVRR